ncbi:MAG: mechanosensitive ion channel domain-containing protein [Rhodospirillales bacterium]
MTRAAAAAFAALAFLAVSNLALTSASLAQSAAPAVKAAGETPVQVRALLNLLSDPAVRDWLDRQQAQRKAPAAPEPVAQDATASGYLAERLSMIRKHFGDLIVTAPKLPGELADAVNILMLEFEESGLVRMLLLIALFVGLGFGAERLYQWIARGVEKWIVALPLDTVADRLRAVGVRLGYGTAMVVVFAIGSLGAFLALEWPPLVRDILLGYLLAFLALRFTMVASRFLMAPAGERFRIVPMSTETAWFWHKRLGLLVGWFGFGWVTVQILSILGISAEARQLVAYTLGLGLLAIGLEAVWRTPAAGLGGRWFGATARNWLVTVYFVALWAMWVASSVAALWLAIVAVGLPAAIRTTRRSVNHILRPPGSAESESSVPSIAAACLERGLRAALIIVAALVLAHVWGVDLGQLASRDTAFSRFVSGAVSAVVIVLLADFAWNVLKTLIDRKLADAVAQGQLHSEEARRRARLRTLLPIVRNVLFIVLVAMSALMVLSSLGVEIGPLIAGAGVVGVAIGFGAQTLVRDIISGMFFLLDDAFRVGEYIQSGNYKGTVESFSLRSVKLRHHRSPLYTVPFGALGAIQNMSRDWVIDKLSIGVTYDTDLDKAKKLIKQVGKELEQDPELGPSILETLKMQGVEQFGDFAIQIRLKMMTKPGEQFSVRRKAYALIKKTFDANDIQFAFPTVQVAGGAGDAAAAVARQSLELAKPPAEG